MRRGFACWIAVWAMLAAGCGDGSVKPTSPPEPAQTVVPPGPAPADDLAAARAAFVSRLRVRGPAPQRYQNEPPPAGARAVRYTSGDLALAGWLSSAPGGPKRPAVVYLHGGFAFGAGDWADAAPFADAGFVVFAPTLRGENGNPGTYENFLGEVNDAVAAGRFVAALPEVDERHVFVAGHSVGGILACLAAMVPSPYAAAAVLDGYVDMAKWVDGAPAAHVPYDRRDPAEVRVRDPMAFAGGLRCPVRLYASPGIRPVNDPFVAAARQRGRSCDLVAVPGDHWTMLKPAARQAAGWFRERSAD